MQTISEKISVILQDNTPLSLIWRNKTYKIDKIGLRHDFYEGKILVHVFSVLSGLLFLKIKFDTKHLNWLLMDISEDGI